MGIEGLFNALTYMKHYGNFSLSELEYIYPFEFDIHYSLTIAHNKKKQPQTGL